MATDPLDEPELEQIPPGIRRSQEAYWRDLPQLLQSRHKGQWVAYHGDERVGFARSQDEIYRECFQRGYRDDDFYVARVTPHYHAPWEIIDID
jgi:hypothetical protein